MRFKKLKVMMLMSLMFVTFGLGNAFAQADALVDMLQKKGLLSQREASEVKEQMYSDIREQMSGTKIKVGGWLDELKLYGDMRVRYERFWNRKVATSGGALTDMSDEQDRERFRYRLRVGADAKAGDWTAGFRLASGDTSGQFADAISTNTTFSNFAAKKPVNVDMAYITYEPSQINGLTFSGGKMDIASIFYETDMVYDPDLTPEGFLEKYKRDINDSYAVFGNFSQWVLFENNTTSGTPAAAADPVIRGKDTYMFGYQVGHEWKIIPKKIELKQAIGYYDYVGLRNTTNVAGASVATAAPFRNSMVSYYGNTVPEDNFSVLTLNQELRLGYWEKCPIRLQGEYINNLGLTMAGQNAYFNEGYKVGFILGEAKKKGQWQAGYWYECLEPNATLSYFSDSDFGNGGTNQKGHVLKTVYMVTDWASVGFSYWNVSAVADVINSGTAGAAVNQKLTNTDRLQCDVIMKF